VKDVRIAGIAVVAAAVVACRGELLEDGGAEAGSLAAWRVIEGDFQTIDHPPGFADPGPREGARYFFAGNAQRSAIEQRIPIRAGARGKHAVLRGVLAAGLGGSRARLTLAAYRMDRSVSTTVTASVTAGETWTEVQVSLIVPDRTAELGVVLEAERDDKRLNAAYADALSLKLEDSAPKIDARLLAGPSLYAPSEESVHVFWALTQPLDVHIVEWGARSKKLEQHTRYPHLELDGLTPGVETEYHFVSRDREGRSIFESKKYRFKLPARDRFRLVLWADNQDGPELFRAKTVPAIEALAPDLMIAAGDLAKPGERRSRWLDQLYTPAAALLARVPWYPARGNHDGVSELALAMLPLPDSGRYYARTYGPLRVVAIDFNTPLDAGSPQHLFLERELAGDPWRSARLRVIASHHPPFTTRWESEGYDGEPAIRERLVPMIEAAGADLFLSGHAHIYERGRRGATHYLIAGGAGGKLDTVHTGDWPHVAVTQLRHHVVAVDLDANAAKFSAIDVESGQVFDRFEIPLR
jgi:hypothetical protein